MGGNGWVIVTFKLPYPLLEKLDRYAIVHGVTRSEVIRRAIMEYLARHEALTAPRIRVKRVVLT